MNSKSYAFLCAVRYVVHALCLLPSYGILLAALPTTDTLLSYRLFHKICCCDVVTRTKYFCKTGYAHFPDVSPVPALTICHGNDNIFVSETKSKNID